MKRLELDQEFTPALVPSKPCRFLPLGLLFFSLALPFLSSCKDSTPTGFLHVKSPIQGSFEIYRIETETPLQLVAEEVGKYNKDISLSVGSYLILADCSSASVVINPESTKTLVAHAVNFVPPVEPQSEDNFVIQCTRYEKTQIRQRLLNRFSLTVLSGKRDLLVAMVPIEIKLTNIHEPTELIYDLSAFQVAASLDSPQTDVRFFVSPLRDQLTVTESQAIGRWLFLLPGDYRVELNGTRQEINLLAKEQKSISPAFLRVDTSDKVDLSASSTIAGNPTYVEINGGHWLNLNETYPVLPGTVQLRLTGSDRTHEFLLEPEQTLAKNVRSVRVELDCPPWDWNCLGSSQIFLFEKNQHYPFASGVTDVPLLFFEEDAWIGLEGSRNLRLHLGPNNRDWTFKTGFLKLKPNHESKPGHVTDLVRIEAGGAPFEGHTFDLPLDEDYTIPLMVGNYYLTQYVSATNVDGDRRKTRRPMLIRPYSTLTVEYDVYVSEKKWTQIKNNRIARITREERRQRFRYSRNQQRAMPVRYQ